MPGASASGISRFGDRGPAKDEGFVRRTIEAMEPSQLPNDFVSPATAPPPPPPAPVPAAPQLVGAPAAVPTPTTPPPPPPPHGPPPGYVQPVHHYGQAAIPGMQMAQAPRPSQASTGALIVKYLVFGFIALITLALISILGLAWLGSTVESEFVEIPQSTGSSFEQPGTVGLPFSGNGSNFSIDVDDAFDYHGTDSFNGEQTYYWSLGSNNDTDWVEMDAWGVDTTEGLSATLLIHQLAQNQTMVVEQINTVTADGATLTTGVLDLDHPEFPVQAYVVVHESEAGYGVAALWASSEDTLSEAVATFAGTVHSVRYQRSID